MSISVCLLNYNSYPDTIECIDSLLQQNMSGFSVIIVDNGSTNESLKKISEHLSVEGIDFSCHASDNFTLTNTDSIATKNKVYLIANNLNNGFSAGNNIAIRFSNEFLKNSKILLLNNDTIIEPDFLEIMNSEFERLSTEHLKPIALGALEYNYFTRQRSHSGFHYLNLPTGLVFSKPIGPYYKYICGACLMIDNKAPFMDEGYFLYFEDIDYSKTLESMGYELVNTEKTHYFHKISASMSDSSFKVKTQFISTWKFYKKHYSSFIFLVFIIRYLQYKLKGKKEITDIVSSTYNNR